MTSKYTDEEWKKILSEYPNMSAQNLAKKYNISRNQVHLRLRKRSLLDRIKSFFKRIPEDKFDDITI